MVLHASRKGIGAALGVVAAGVVGLVLALRTPAPGAPTRKARKIVSALRTMRSSPLDFDALPKPASVDPRQPAEAQIPTARKAARVTLPGRATEPLQVQDATSGMTIGIQPKNVFDVAAQSADGYYVYPHAHASGGTLLHRALPDGAEDFVSFETRPAVPEVGYQIALGDEVSGLRLVGNTLEMVDEDGTPRLRAEPPYIVGADGARTDATLAVEGCVADTDASAPWGRDAVDPGARTCTLRVRWPDENVVYPAVLDPRWTTTGSMTTPRQGHTATLLSTGNVLVVGGTSNGTTALASAELYNRTTGTWAATASMTGARTLHTATQLNTGSNGTTSGKVLVAGGLNGSTSQNTAQLYSPSAGTWTAAANLLAARHGQTATLLASGKVLLAGGLTGTTVLNTAALYDPSSGTGTWTATGTMPQAVKLHTATRLNVPSNGTLNNKVLVVGGNSGTGSVANVQLFDGTSTWSSLTALSSPREGETATALANGNVLVAGGKNGSTVLNTTQLFNAASGSGSWASAGTLTTGRQLHAALLLPSGLQANGQVLLAGGNSGTNTLSSAELWNGTTTWTATTALPSAVQAETVTLLPNNMVLVAGGVNGATTVAAADLYDASFSLACTSNSQCATGFCASGVCCDTACNGGCGVCNLTGHVGTCSAASSGTVCRAANGACDAAETCNGTSLTCPTDGVAPLGTVCRAANGACDVPETCDGTTKGCPADGFAPSTTVCRASTGTCDAAETCTGTSAACPADGFAPAGTVCRPSAGGCDAAETCSGTSALCPADGVAAAGTVCRPAESICDLAESCDGTSSACPTDTFAAAGTACGAATGNAAAPVCSGATGTCPVAEGTSDVLGFEAATDWTLDSGDNGTTAIVGLNANRTQGASSLEVAAQNYARFNSAPMSSIGSVGPLVLLDVLLPTDQANQFWYGDAQMFVNSPSLGILNVFLSDVPMTGLALGTWQTLAFQMPVDTAATIAHGVYSDLTFSVVLNVPFNENGHYLIDNIRSIPDVVPSLLGVAQDGTILKAIFDYQTTSSTPVNIPYGTANGLTNQNGFVASPPEVPPATFVPTTHAPFVATLSGSLLTWTVGSHSVTATPSSQQLTVTTLPDGTHDANLPDGRKVNIDSTPPANPTTTAPPPVGDPFNGVLMGQFSVSPAGAATFALPISIPPGIAGMAPNLALVYNSQGGDGIAGQGWSLSGLSMITRCPRTRQQDGYGRPVMIDSLSDPSSNSDGRSDGICLDGKKLFETSPGSGSYLAESQDFSTITRTGTEFQVVTKAGETRYYGHANATNIRGTIWLLDRVVDQWGNFFNIHYNNDAGNGSPSFSNTFTESGIWVSKIDYTGSLETSGCATEPTPASCTFASVTFQYECRPDVRWTTMGTLRIPQTQRLKSITTPQGTYSLTYGTPAAQNEGGPDEACSLGLDPISLGTSVLGSIGYCAGSMCMQPLTFGWNSGGVQWQGSSGFTLPSFVGTGKGLKGTQFVDLDGDGRADFILARTNGKDGPGITQRSTVLNTGTGWGPELTGPRTFPLSLSDANDNPTGVRFADFDGDGRLDVIVDSADVVCGSDQCLSCPVGGTPGGPGCINPKHYQPAVWLNRFTPGGGGWEFDEELSGGALGPPQSVSFTGTNPTMVADLDGDGLADLVRVDQSFDSEGQEVTTTVTMLLNKHGNGPGWSTQIFTTQDAGFFPSSARPPFQVQDVNRDGLADLVHEDFFSLPDGSATSSETVLLNTGESSSGGINFSLLTQGNSGGGSAIDLTQKPPRFADIDGDGFYDLVDYEATTSSPFFFAAVGLGNGTGYGFGSDSIGSPYFHTLLEFTPPEAQQIAFNFDDGYALQDINGDGLVDLIRDHFQTDDNQPPILGGGEILLNTGRNWLSVSGRTSYVDDDAGGPQRIPATVPSEDTTAEGSAFVDLDGDGLPDIVQEEDNTSLQPHGAWLNPYQRLVITSFPNGLAEPTTVSYLSTSSAKGAGTYTDDDTTDANTKAFAVPVTVVSSVQTEDGSGTAEGQNTTTYTYHSMRQDALGRGPLGFHRVEVFDQASNVRTVTTYAQAYPYTGMPIEVDRYQVVGSQAHQISKTTTAYCDTVNFTPGLGCGSVSPGSNPPSTTTFSAQADVVPTPPPGTTTFVYPSTITDVAYLHPETDDLTDTITTLSTFLYDQFGNPTATQTGVTRIDGNVNEAFKKTVENTYATQEEQLEGKPDSTTVINTHGTNGTVHTTTFEYVPTNTFGGLSSRLALSKKHVEPKAGWPVRLDTAYKYDPFGNVIMTTSCASDFDSCLAGAKNPSNPDGSGDSVHHPPFRTTTVSFDPTVLGSPVSYGVGRFPAATMNAVGQTETTVYDPILGKPLTKTGPNGIETCFTYDLLGRPTSETDRCNSAAPLVTTTQYFRVLSQVCVDQPCTAGFSPPNSVVVTVTTPPTKAPTWSYADDQGKSTGTLAYAFDGGFIETTAAYDALGQVTQVAKPFHLASLANQPPVSYTQTSYDDFHRVQAVTDPLDVIDASGVPKSTTITTSYNGSTVETDRIVNGATQTHLETKNAIGKVSAETTITESGPKTISYLYDADGNLTLTTDPAGNQVQIGYDVRGRKNATVDPDMGSWSYTSDGFGDLIVQTDAKQQTTTMAYDQLGRMVTKTDATGTAEWVYDTAPGAGKGKLAAMVSAPDSNFVGACAIPGGFSVAGGNRAVKSFKYTVFGDVQEVDECADGASFATSYQYDALGRQSLIRYPVVNASQLAVGYHYTTLGYLQYLTDESSDYSVLWQAKVVNVLGQVTDEQMRNGVETQSTRNPVTGWLISSTATAHADHDNVIQDQSYGFDEIGNLLTRSRKDAASGAPSSEAFGYDLTNRLISAVTTTSGGTRTEPYAYDPDSLGNLTQKGNSTYSYGTGCLAGSRAAGPHAVCSVGTGSQFTYDGDGSLTSDGSHSVTYNPSNKVTGIEGGGANVAFMYGADQNRVVQAVTSGTTTTRTIYVGLGATGKSLYEQTTTAGGTTKHVHYIYAGGVHGGNAFALRVLDDSGALTASQYYSFDHLGSVTAMSDDSGRVTTAQSGGTSASVLGYDPWGARRSPDGTTADPASFALPTGDREFTGQEQIPDVGLVNMNGRVYDPALGRFLSPDPHVQFVADLQSYNRYTYVNNNPLSYTDPTGYSTLGDIGHWFASTFSNPLTDFEIGFSLIACLGSAASVAIACGVAVGLTIAAMNAGIAIASGAGFEQTVALTAIGLGVGMVAGAAAGGGLTGLIVGSASAAVTTGISNVAAGRSFFGYDMLGAAFLSAAQGAATMGLNQLIAVSQASVARAYAANPQGAYEGNDSGEEVGEFAAHERALYTGAGMAANSSSDATSRAEIDRQIDAVLAGGGNSGHAVSDDELLAASNGEASVHPGSVRDADKLDTLDPTFKGPATRVVDRMVAEGYNTRVVWGRRTPEENEVLVEKGLASPTSKHLDGLAVDLINRADPYPNDPQNSYYLDLRDAVKAEGLIWGGYCWGNCTTTRWDPTHFEAP
jgi:RHS repeat-associated protein